MENKPFKNYRSRRKRSERASRKDEMEGALVADKIWLRRKEAKVVINKIKVQKYERED